MQRHLFSFPWQGDTSLECYFWILFNMIPALGMLLLNDCTKALARCICLYPDWNGGVKKLQYLVLSDDFFELVDGIFLWLVKGVNGTFSWRLLSGAVRLERLGMNFPKYVIIPKKR